MRWGCTQCVGRASCPPRHMLPCRHRLIMAHSCAELQATSQTARQEPDGRMELLAPCAPTEEAPQQEQSTFCAPAAAQPAPVQQVCDTRRSLLLASTALACQAPAAVQASGRTSLLQGLPTAAEVESLAGGLQERGPQQLNAEQRHAVASVLLRAGGATPFALWGPPGTGKTVSAALWCCMHAHVRLQACLHVSALMDAASCEAACSLWDECRSPWWNAPCRWDPAVPGPLACSQAHSHAPLKLAMIPSSAVAACWGCGCLYGLHELPAGMRRC